MTSPIFQAGVVYQAGPPPPPPSVVPPTQWNINGMFFDAWLTLNHDNTVTSTSHPVEFGANITDHAYSEPIKFSFDIGMTDVFSSPNYPGTGTRSVNAYNTLVDLMNKREFVTLDCKYGSYINVLIINITAYDDKDTVYASKFTVNLEQKIVVETKTVKASTNQNATSQTNRGKVSPQPGFGTKEAIIEGLKKLNASPGFISAVEGFL